LFTRTQNFGSHHYYLLIPQIEVFAGALAGALASIRHAALRATLCAGLGSILLLDFLSAFVPGVQPALGPLAAAFASRVYYPMVRDDLDEVARLTRVLDALTHDGSEKIYVLASSLVLNEDVLRNAHLVDASLPDLEPRILRASHVDKRDGFPWRLELANYVVLTAPVGYHLDPTDQRVIGHPRARSRERYDDRPLLRAPAGRVSSGRGHPRVDLQAQLRSREAGPRRDPRRVPGVLPGSPGLRATLTKFMAWSGARSPARERRGRVRRGPSGSGRTFSALE
jgi:hypothetical protein